jgi:urease accessory protein
MPPQSGRLDLELELDGERTRPRRALATPPLQISRARYDDPAAPGRLSLTLIHLGGVLAGDQYELSVSMAAGAATVVAAAAATQIYTMTSGSAQQETVIRLAPGSTLCWMPGPQVLFAGARYCQSTRVELSPGAFLMLYEVLVPGRLARGECWRFGRYASTIEVVDQRGALLAGESICVEPGRRSPAIPGVMGRFTVHGSLWLLSDRIDAERAAKAINTKDGTQSAAILPAGSGIVVRSLSTGLSAAQQSLHRCYTALIAEKLIPKFQLPGL